MNLRWVLLLIGAVVCWACSNPGAPSHTPSCVPECADKACGEDGCGGTCGSCLNGWTCTAAGTCDCTAESPTDFCRRMSTACGPVTGIDNCGKPRTETCDLCQAPKTCHAAERACLCDAETDLAFCQHPSKHCGTVTAVDSCGKARTAECGDCDPGQTCDTATTLCGPCDSEDSTTFCQRLGKECGTVTALDNCSLTRTYDCGACLATEECGKDNQCHCKPETNAELCQTSGTACGSLSVTDRCGLARTIADCGSCSPSEVCNAGSCCAPEPDTALCAAQGRICGKLTATDQCGQSRLVASCGSCSGGLACVAGACVVCTPEDDPTFCTRLGKSCGSVTELDNCGFSRTVPSCGTCTSPQYCDPIGGACTSSTAPRNDGCIAAQPITFDATGRATFLADDTLATDSGDPSCNTYSGNDLVFSFTLLFPKDVDISAVPLPGSGARPTLYVRAYCDQASSELACVKTSTDNTPAYLSLTSLPAGTYYLWVDDFSPAWISTTYGPQVVSVQVSTPAPPAPNDSCANPKPLTFIGDTATDSATTRGATNNSTGTCASTTMDGLDVVYSFALASDAGVRVTVTGTTPGFTPSFYIVSSCDSGGEKLCAAGVSGRASRTSTTALQAGITYFLIIDSVAGSGAFDLEVTKGVLINDNCDHPEPLQFGATGLATVSGNTTDVVDNGRGTCSQTNPQSRTGHDVVYSVNTVGMGRQRLDATLSFPGNAGFGPLLYLRSACSSAAPADELTCSATASGGTVRISTSLAEGTYYLWVDAEQPGDSGPFDLTAQLTPLARSPLNDTCLTPEPLSLTAGMATATGSTIAAINDYSGSCDNHNGGDIAYELVLTRSAVVTALVAAADPAVFSKPAVYLRGSTCTSTATADEYACATGARGAAAVSTPSALDAGTYYVIVDGASGQGGDFTLQVTAASELNDACAAAWPLVFDATGYAIASGDLSVAGDDAEGSCRNTPGGHDVVYSLSTIGRGRQNLAAALTFTNNSGKAPMLYLRSVCASAAHADEQACFRVGTGGTVSLVTNLPEGTYYLWVDDDYWTPESPTFLLTVQLTPVGASPANDTCRTPDALRFAGGTASVTASTSAANNDYWASCGGMGGPDTVHSMSLSQAAKVTATVTATNPAAYATPVVYIRGANCASSLAGDQYACNAGSSGTAIAIANALDPGTYYIVVDGVSGAGGDYSLQVTLDTPFNDTCNYPAELTFDGTGLATASGDTTIAVDDARGTCSQTGGGLDAVYRFSTVGMGRQNLAATVTYNNSAVGPVLYLRSVCASAAAASELACSRADVGGTIAIGTTLDEGTYFLWVDEERSREYGPFHLSVQLTPAGPPPTNDACNTPEDLFVVSGRVSVNGSTTNALDDTTGTCGNLNGPDTVYRLQLTQSAMVTATVIAANPTLYSTPAVYIRGDPCLTAGPSNEYACNVGSSGTVAATATALAAGAYYIFVDGASASAGNFTLRVTVSNPLPDNCANASPLSFMASGLATAWSDTTLAGDDATGTCSQATGGGRDLVFSVSTVGMGRQNLAAQLTFSATNSSPVLYLRSTCASAAPAHELACSRLRNGSPEISVNLPEGTYYLWVDDDSASHASPFQLDVQLTSLASLPPPNDTCSSPEGLTFISGVATATGSTAAAADDYSGTCGNGRLNGGDAVYSLTLTQAAKITATVTASTPALYATPAVFIRGANCTDAKASNQGACAAGSLGTAIAVAPGLSAGTYYVFVDGASGSGGDFTLKVALDDPFNDTCTTPTPITFYANGQASVSGDTTFAQDDARGTCAQMYGGKDVVYSISTVGRGRTHLAATVSFGTSHTNFAPMLYLRSACASKAASDELACNRAGAITSLSANLEEGTYFLWVDEDSSPFNVAIFNLDLALTPLTTPLPNDTCLTPATLTFNSEVATISGSTSSALNDYTGTCGNLNGGDAVYMLTLPQASQVTAQVTSTSLATFANPAVYIRGATCTSSASSDEYACAADSSRPGTGTATARASGLDAGTYYVIVDGLFGQTGGYTLNVTLSPPVFNDTCYRPEPLVFNNSGVATASGNTTNATQSGDGSCRANQTGADLVYTFTTMTSKAFHAEISASGSTLQPVLYLRTQCSGGVELACNTNATPGGTTSLDIGSLDPGTYYLWVDSNTRSSVGAFTLTVTLTAPPTIPANDSCATAEPLNAASGYVVVSGSTASAANDARSTCAAGAGTDLGRDVVYSFTTTAPQKLVAQVVQSDSSTVYAPLVYLRSVCNSSADSDEVACAAAAGPGYQAGITVSNLPSGTYYLWIDGVGTFGGGFMAWLTFSPPDTTVATNDTCFAAQQLSFVNDLATVSSATTVGAQNDASGSCGGTTGPDLVYTFTTTAEKKVSAKVTAAGGFTPVVSIRSVCGYASTQLTCASGASTVTAVANALPSGTYWVWVDSGSYHPSGTFTLQVALAPPIIAPYAGKCASATALTYNVPFDGDTTTSGNDFNLANACSLNGVAFGTAGNDFVFTYTPSISGPFTVSAYQPGTKTSLGDSGGWDSVLWIANACDDGACMNYGTYPPTAKVPWAVAGVTYWIILDGQYPYSQGPFTILVY